MGEAWEPTDYEESKITVHINDAIKIAQIAEKYKIPFFVPDNGKTENYDPKRISLPSTDSKTDFRVVNITYNAHAIKKETISAFVAEVKEQTGIDITFNNMGLLG